MPRFNGGLFFCRNLRRMAGFATGPVQGNDEEDEIYLAEYNPPSDLQRLLNAWLIAIGDTWKCNAHLGIRNAHTTPSISPRRARLGHAARCALWETSPESTLSVVNDGMKHPDCFEMKRAACSGKTADVHDGESRITQHRQCSVRLIATYIIWRSTKQAPKITYWHHSRKKMHKLNDRAEKEADSATHFSIVVTYAVISLLSYFVTV